MPPFLFPVLHASFEYEYWYKYTGRNGLNGIAATPDDDEHTI